MKKKLQQTKRFFKIISVCLSFIYQAFVKMRGTSENIERKRAILLREHIEKLGSVFVKFGQFLSIHPALLPPIYCEELFYLLENVPPFSKDAVLKTFKEEFHKKPEEIFKIFDLQPFAAASFGQVHKAILSTGKKVVVKIQRPHIYKTVEEDIILMKLLAVIIDFFPLGPNKFNDAVREFELWTKEELDYLKEAEMTDEYYSYVNKKREDIIAPKVYKNFSSKRILTTEFIEGITLSKILLAIRNNDKKLLQQLKEMGFSRKNIAMKLTTNSLKQVYVKGFFHGDPHPANIIYTKDGHLAYIDFGICGRLTKKERILSLRYARSFWYRDFENAFDALMQLTDTTQVSNKIKMKEDFIKLLQHIHLSRERNHNELGSFRSRSEFPETLKFLQKYKTVMPTSVMLYYRTIITLRNIGFLLYPEMEATEIIRQLKKISILNIVNEFPTFFSKEHREIRLVSLINFFEKELTQN